jgi:hypothetical protein
MNLSRKVPTVFAVLPAPDRMGYCFLHPNANIAVLGSGGWSFFIIRRDTLMTAPYHPTPTLGRMIHSIRPFSWAH